MNKTIKFLSVYSVLAIAMVTGGAFSATTTGAARPSIASTASRVKVAGGASTMRTPTMTAPKTTAAPAPVTESVVEPEPEPERVIVVDNKTSQFDDVLSDIAGIAPDSSASDLAERVRQQRALLDGAANSTLETSGIKMGANACDSGLRKCMAEKCGNDFTKCANDSTAIWGDKMDSCRRTTNCTGHEYSLLAPEILADRDMNVRMSYYNSVLNCGNRYNSCIFNECGKYMDKCLAKSDGDRAVAKCESIARECREQDNGLASRVMSAFGGLRTIATEQVKKDEARLYELRDLMRTQCNRLGAMFDERTLDCVYTVNFFAGDDTETPKASKKLYAGDTFQCNANWFGVDVTTFKENAYRLTRSQTSASAAMLGAGVGTAAGLVSSGAINRAIDTQNAEAAAKQACANDGGTWKNGKCEKSGNNNTPVNNSNNNVAQNPGGQENKKSNTNPTEKITQILNESGKSQAIADIYECTTQYKTQELCDDHQDKCTWNGTNCIAKSSTSVNATAATVTTTTVSTEDNNNKPTTNNNKCTTDFTQLAQDLQLDTPINISGCTGNILNNGINLLTNACNKLQTRPILKSDNKTIAMRHTSVEKDATSFTCKLQDVYDYSYAKKQNVAEQVAEWDAERDPGPEACANECANIKPFTFSELEQRNYSGRTFKNPQCLKQCASAVQAACDNLKKERTNVSWVEAMYLASVNTRRIYYYCKYPL